MEPLDRILERFEQLSGVPRGTRYEAGIRQWLQQWAGTQGLASRVDAVGNLLIQIPASPGYEVQPTVVLQGHMDMVWQKIPNSAHDFTRDPIRILRNGEWLTADGTTLGADNGIAIALMMALAEETGLPHPALELLLTVEEELGATGAKEIDPGLLSGRFLINLDSEEEGVFTIGCAGGWTLYITLPAAWAPPEAGWETLRLKVDGLRGGHSGGDINAHRGNANKLLGRALACVEAEIPVRLAVLKGGTVRNAIPREAEAVFAVPPGKRAPCRERLNAFEAEIKPEYAGTDEGLHFMLEEAASPASLVTRSDARQMIRLLCALPNGLTEMSILQPGLVQTSNNIGIMELNEEGLNIVSNHRSQIGSCLDEIMLRVESIAQLSGAHTRRNDRTSPWEPRPGSRLLAICRDVYEREFGAPPKVESTHGGLECGLLNARFEGLDCISMGPTILNPHSPDERLQIPSVERTWKLLAALLRSFRAEGS